MRFQNCYKILINCLYDWDIWTSEDALWIDKCSQSTKTEVNIYDSTLTSSQLDYTLFGEVDETTNRLTDPSTVNHCIAVNNYLVATAFLPNSFRNLFAFNVFKYVSDGVERNKEHSAYFSN